jgi:hypothetical protein
LAGGCGRNGTILKYDRDGGLLWEYYFKRPEGLGYSLDVDEEDNVLFAGLGRLVKLDVAGRSLWVKEEQYYWYQHVKTDGKGGIYFTFRSYIDGGPPFLAKLDNGGRELWRENPGPSYIRGLMLDPTGRPIVAVENPDNSHSLIKYDPAGNILWSAPAPMGFYIEKILVDDFGHPYLLGQFEDGLVKLDPLGQFLWRVIGTQSSIWTDVVLDSKGIAYTIERRDEGPVLWKLSPDGRRLARSDDLNLSYLDRLYLDSSDTLFTVGRDKSEWERQQREGLPPQWERPLYIVSEIDTLGNVVAQVTFGDVETIAPTNDGELIVSAAWPPRIVGEVGTDSEYLLFRFRPSGKKLFLRGDVNRDGTILIDDAIGVLEWLFRGGSEPACRDAADSNDDGRNDITDPVYILNHLFIGGPAPLPPFPAEGPDPTTDGLGCSP